ncbi:hypothetical protein FQA39_LY07208 [Lamprigera yunnana]|nr:hypothetical protein FQA39_LY07208 [Lamprigera yunnana]
MKYVMKNDLRVKKLVGNYEKANRQLMSLKKILFEKPDMQIAVVDSGSCGREYILELVDIKIVVDQEILIRKLAEFISEAGVVSDTAGPEYNPESDREQQIIIENANETVNNKRRNKNELQILGKKI